VVVGAASRDVVADDPRGWRLGGGASYCSLTAARLGLRVGCLLGVDETAAEEAGEELALLADAGVEVFPVRLKNGPVFENIESDGHRRQRWLSKSDLIPPAALPAEWRNAAAWLMVPVAGEIGDEWAASIPDGSVVAVGWQGLLREFAADGWVNRIGPSPSVLLRTAALVAASVDDLAGETRLDKLAAFAPDATLVLTAGAGGGLVHNAGRITRYRAASADFVDATGAGDVFLAALVAAWLLTGELATAATLRFAAAAGSCAVEGLGLGGVPTRMQVADRLRAGRAGRAG
jgi:sugar/nucleoside kinase (ribokinase family)